MKAPFGYIFENRFYRTIEGLTFSDGHEPVPVYHTKTVEKAIQFGVELEAQIIERDYEKFKTATDQFLNQ